jgi:arginine exporter protein ArgO
VTFDLLTFVAFGFVTAVTPGPNNVMLLASGVNFGFLRSVPHILGTAFGMVVMIAGVGVGLGCLFRAYPVLYGVLRWVGAASTCSTWPGASRGAGRPRPAAPGPDRWVFGRRRVPVGEP